MSKAAPVADLCVLTLGWVHVLVPAEKGLKVAALLRGAVQVRHATGSTADWEIDEELRVNYETTKASRVRANPSDAPTSKATALIGVEPLTLPRR